MDLRRLVNPMRPLPKDDIYDDFVFYFDEENMVILYAEEVEGEDTYIQHEWPARFDICPACQGKGKYTNPAIDENGISPEELFADPDFAEDYRNGRYDIPCAYCDARKVVPVADHSCTPAEKQKFKTLLARKLNRQREYWHEMQMMY